MRAAYLHDLRRSLLNRTLLLLLAVLVAAGLGLGYLTASLSAAQQERGYYLVGEVQANASGARLVGLVVSSSGAPAAGARVFYVGPGGREEVATTNASGYVSVELAPGPVAVTVEVGGRNYTLVPAPAAVVGVDLAAREATLVFAAPPSPGLLYYRAYEYQEPEAQLLRIAAARPANATYLGEYGPGIHEVRIRVEPDEPVVVVVLEPVAAPGAPVVAGNVTEYVTAGALMARALRDSALAEAAGVVAEFLPLAGVFLVNDLFARPRATRAIELVLARPITKPELFSSRYLGGLGALAVSAAAASAALGAASWPVLGVAAGPADVAAVFGSLLASLAGLYSLLYLVAALTRRHFLAAAIVLYLALYLANPGLLLAAATGSAWALYVSPYSVASAALQERLAAGLYQLLPEVSYAGLAAAAAAWAAAPALAAAAIYSRSDEA